MGSISVTFHGDTMAEVVRDMADWLAAADGGPRARRASPTRALPVDDETAVARVISGVHGDKSRMLLRLLADAGRKGEAVMLNDALKSGLGVAGGTSFAGMVGPVNRRSSAVLGRPLIESGVTESGVRTWRIRPEDAEIVAEALLPSWKRDRGGARTDQPR